MKTMRQLLTILLTACVVLTIPSTTRGQNVTTIVHDTDSVGVQTLMRSDDYNGSGQASYTTINSVVSDIYNGVLFLDLFYKGQTLRTLYITPNDPYAPAQNPPVPIPPAGYYRQYVEMTISCYDATGNIVPLQNIITPSGNCGLGVDFGYNGVKYKLVMRPVLPAPGPVTGLATVTCNAISNGQCVNWTTTPNANSSPANVANLYYYAKGPGKLTYLGQYYNTYRIDVTNP
jgi:hypothetical protein